MSAAVLSASSLMPPPEPGRAQSYAIAGAAHLALLAALAFGTQWNHSAPTAAAEAELWSALPTEAAPAPAPAPVVPPVLAAPVPAPPPQAVEEPDADIALRKKEQEAQKKRLAEAQKALEKQAEDKKQVEKERQDKLKAEQQKLAAANAAKAASAAKKTTELAEQKQREAEREKNLRDMLAKAGGGTSANPNSAGTAAVSSGPSAGYAGRIRARIKPNIVYTEDAAGNPSAEVEVRLSPDGTITSRRVSKPSGNKAWDEAVVRAIDRTEVLPRDENGKVPPVMILSFRPRD
jgi:colicin import membrane protein